MLEQKFEQMYLQFRANYYRRMVQAIGVRDGSLSATEAFCVEIIYLLKRPTVTQFARFLGVSIPNANYKITSLVKKGYVTKAPSSEDRREFRLEVTDKFLAYYGLNDGDNARLMQDIRASFDTRELKELEAVIDRVLSLMRKEGGPDSDHDF